MSLMKRGSRPKRTAGAYKGKKWLGVLCICLAVIVAFVLMPLAYKSKEATQSIVVAVQNIEQGSVISDKQVAIRERGTYGLSGYILEIKDVVGKKAAADFSPDDIVLKNKIGKGSSSVIEDGEKLMTVSLKSIAAGVASHLKPGDLVDVYTVIDDGYAKSPALKIRKIEVYSIENANAESLGDAQNEGAGANNDYIANTITLVTTAEEQQNILLQGEYNGSLHFVLSER